jgi:hypothetical protein
LATLDLRPGRHPDPTLRAARAGGQHPSQPDARTSGGALVSTATSGSCSVSSLCIPHGA